MVTRLDVVLVHAGAGVPARVRVTVVGGVAVTVATALGVVVGVRLLQALVGVLVATSAIVLGRCRLVRGLFGRQSTDTSVSLWGPLRGAAWQQVHRVSEHPPVYKQQAFFRKCPLLSQLTRWRAEQAIQRCGKRCGFCRACRQLEHCRYGAAAVGAGAAIADGHQVHGAVHCGCRRAAIVHAAGGAYCWAQTCAAQAHWMACHHL